MRIISIINVLQAFIPKHTERLKPLFFFICIYTFQFSHEIVLQLIYIDNILCGIYQSTQHFITLHHQLLTQLLSNFLLFKQALQLSLKKKEAITLKNYFQIMKRPQGWSSTDSSV